MSSKPGETNSHKVDAPPYSAIANWQRYALTGYRNKSMGLRYAAILIVSNQKSAIIWQILRKLFLFN